MESQEKIEELSKDLQKLADKFSSLMDKFEATKGEDADVHWELLEVFPHYLKARADYLHAIKQLFHNS